MSDPAADANIEAPLPADLPEAPAPEPAPAPDPAPEPARTPRKRAPSTQAKERVAARTASAAAAGADEVVFVSTEPEDVGFQMYVAGQAIASRRDPNTGHVTWRVPVALADRFAMHDFVVRGRIMRAE
jgi:hypothetical protein